MKHLAIAMIAIGALLLTNTANGMARNKKVNAPDQKVVKDRDQGCPFDGKEPVDWVDPHIDTVRPRWLYFASACRPFGLVNLSPDTHTEGTWNSGYRYNDSHIQCFSHIHAWQLSGIPVMPGVGDIKAHKGFTANQATFSHDDEIAKPGYHKVILSDRDITVELTSTCRVGFHRYHFPASASSHIAFSLNEYLGTGPMRASGVKQVNDHDFSGYVTMAPTGSRRKKPCTAYFYASLSKPFNHIKAWQSGSIVELSDVTEPLIGAFIEFPTTQNEVVQLKIALSYVSQEQAYKNLTAELPHWNFDQVVADSRNEWNQLLGKIEIKGGTDAQRIKFYTDLWHAMLGRRSMNDADGKYIDNTGPTPRVCQVQLDAQGKPMFNHLNFDALWGCRWSLQPLWSLVYPHVMDTVCNTLVDMYNNGGLIPRGPSGGNYTFVMTGDPAASFIACAYAKGIRNWDVARAYEGLRKNAFLGGICDRAGYESSDHPAGGGMRFYLERGYIPLHNEGKGFHHHGTASCTLEYAYQDWCRAQMAKAMGKQDDYELFMKRSQNYRNVFDANAGQVVDPVIGFDPSVGWMRPRELDGSWYQDFYPVNRKKLTEHRSHTVQGFVEGNSAIYTWFVPQDIPGLAELMGGPDKAIAKLNRQFELAADNHFLANPDLAHHTNWIDYNNQPGTHLAHIFNHLGAPWLTQYWVRRVKQDTYGDITPFGGYNGDEDQGQMGALGVLMSIGLFDLQGGADREPDYEITTPLFDKVTIHLDNVYYPGKTFTITCQNQSPENVYIQSAALNGQLWNDFRIPHSVVVKGGTLELLLGPTPNKQWGVSDN